MPKLAERLNGLDGVSDALRTAVRTALIELDEDYSGWVATMRVNPSVQVWEDFASGEEERFNAAMQILVLEWNFVDDEGHGLPLPREGLDWRQTPFDLKVRLTNAYSAVVRDRMRLGKLMPTPSEPTSPNDT